MKSKPNRFVAVRGIQLAALSVCLAPGVFAATWQWDGGAGTGNWQSANNWNPNALNPNFNGTFADRLNVNGAQELIYSAAEGVTNYGGATVRGLVIGSGAAGSGTMTITGGTFSSLNATGANQDVIGNNDNNVGILNVSGGTFIGAAGGTNLGLGGGTGRVSTLNVNSGSATVTTLTLNSTAGSVNLVGGTLAVNSIVNTSVGGINSVINFNGGTLKARQSTASFLNTVAFGTARANVRNGGAVIDTNGFDVTIALALSHSNIGGDNATDGGLTKNSAGTLTLSAVPTYTGTTTVNAGTLAYNLSGSYSYGNVISGAGNISKAGSGTVTLTGDNSYAGTTSVTGGTLSLTGSGDINSSSGITLNGATAKLNASSSAAVSPVVTLTQGTLTGSGTVNTVNVGAGTGGIITNNDGVAGNDLAIGTLTLAGGATINLFSNSTSAPLTVTSLVNNSAANQVTLTANNAGGWVNGSTYDIVTYGGGSIGGTGGYNFNKTVNNLTARQFGTWADTGTAITLGISGDTVTWTGAANGNWTTSVVGSPFNWKTTGGLANTDFLASDEVIFDDAGATSAVEILDANVSPSAITFNNSSINYTVSSAGGFGIASGTLTKNGSGTVNLATTNTYTGTTSINGGTLQVSGGSAIANSGLVSIANAAGATFQVSASETIGALSGGGGTGGSVTIDAGQTLTLSSGTQTFAGAISGGGALTISGAVQTLNGALSHGGGISLTTGRLTLGGNNSYTGQTTVSAGAGVIVTANNALGATGAGNETVILGPGGANSGAIGLSGGITYGAGEKVIGAGLSNTAANGAFASVQRGIVQSISGDNTFAGNIEISSAGITRFGTQDGADLTLTGSITRGAGVTGVTVLFRPGISGDWVTVSGSGSNWDSETLIFLTSGNTAAGGVRLGANDALSTIATLRAGGNTTGSGNTLDLNGFNQTIGGLFNSNGTLHITNNAASTNSVLTLNTAADWSTDSITNKTTIEDGLGQVSLVKTGSFTQTLVGTHTYTGQTTVSNGKLVINGNISTSSLVSVASGATLAGSGTVGNTLINGTLAPGNSPGALTVDAGTMQLGAGGNLNWQVYDATGVAGTGYDSVNLINGATLDLSLLGALTPFNINLWSLSGISPDANGDAINFDNTLSYSWTLFASNQAITGFDAGYFNILTASNNGAGGFSNALAGGYFSVSLGDSDTDLVLHYTPVPEPRAVLIGSLGLLALLRRRR